MLVVRTSADALGAPAAAVLLLGAEGRLDRRVSVGFAGDAGGPERLEDGNFGTVSGEDRVVAVADLETAGLGASPLAQAGMRAALGGAVARGRAPDRGDRRLRPGLVRSWTELEMQLLQLAAERLATSIERARITDEQRNVADRLQRALEPTRLPRLHGLTLAGRYEPPSCASAATGTTPSTGHARGLVIGDVVGHGIEAAAAAVRLRHFLRGFVMRGYGPGQAIGALDTLVLDEPDAANSSMVYA